MTEITIDALGSLGHGIARSGSTPLYVARTIPGERVTVTGTPPHVQLGEVVMPSADRVEPRCAHFQQCGGCTFQHMALDAQRDWKRREVERAFAKAGVTVTAEPMVGPADDQGYGHRRRVTFTAWREGGAVHIGFREQGGEERVAIGECPILEPALEAAIAPLRALLAPIVQGQAEQRVHVLVTADGLDIAVETEVPPNEDALAALVRNFARSEAIRVAVDGEVMAQRGGPTIAFESARVTLPPAAFLQASREAQDMMVALVTGHLKKSKRVADLFAGLGTFTFPLSQRAKVHAVEGDAAAVDALHRAQRDGGKAVTSQVRDLYELPLTARELEPYDAICLDPPRAGAQAQVAEIARSTVRRVAYVSCNPTTQARDVAMLVKAGFELQSVTPVDQFVHSPHIEAVALLEKPNAKKARSIFR